MECGLWIRGCGRRMFYEGKQNVSSLWRWTEWANLLGVFAVCTTEAEEILRYEILGLERRSRSRNKRVSFAPAASTHPLDILMFGRY